MTNERIFTIADETLRTIKSWGLDDASLVTAIGRAIQEALKEEQIGFDKTKQEYALDFAAWITYYPFDLDTKDRSEQEMIDMFELSREIKFKERGNNSKRRNLNYKKK